MVSKRRRNKEIMDRYKQKKESLWLDSKAYEKFHKKL